MNSELPLAKMDAQPPAVAPMTAMQILQEAIRGGISKESVDVVAQLHQMVKEERDDAAKVAFKRAFFQMRREMPVIYADKEVRTKNKDVAFMYSSPEEIKDVLEPMMHRHGFTTMTGQTLDHGEATATVTLIHEAGHSEDRSFTVHVSPGNEIMNPSKCDAAASSNAERHCIIKMFGLRTRIKAEDDPRNKGEMISPELAEELERRVKETNSVVSAFLKFAGSKTGKFADIPASRYAECDSMLRRKEKEGK